MQSTRDLDRVIPVVQAPDPPSAQRGGPMQLVARHLRALTLVVFVATWAVRLAAGGLLWSDDNHSGTPRPASDASTTIAHLLHAHDCWREKAPADMRGQVPGHVV